jgi:Ni,Fe-hydrogenase III large subunit
MEDERVVEALPAIGYVHRGLEKLAEQKDFHQNVFLIERVCGICSFMHGLAYCQGIEQLMGLTVPERARYLRVVWSELHRLHSHLLWLGLLADSLGFENLFMQAWRVREEVLDIMEATAGGRIILGTCAIGGVRRDIPPELLVEVGRTLDRVQRGCDEIASPILEDYTVSERLRDVGRITQQQARELGAVGPVARAAGIAFDHRCTGYAAYGELDFQPVVEETGDCHARLLVRVRELHQSVALVRRAIGQMPAGALSVPVKGRPDGEVVSRLEQPRGEVVYYLKANGTRNLERLRIRTPTFANVPALLAMLAGCQLADVPAITLSIDPCISCTER